VAYKNIIVWIITRKKQMRERIEAYQELKYTALNCWIEADDIPFLIDYIIADFEGKKKLRSTLVKKKSRAYAVSVISQLSKTNPKALEVLENSISHIVYRRESEAREEYESFLKGLDTDDNSRKLLAEFVKDPRRKLLIIPRIPKFEELSCVAIDHVDIADEYWIIERISRVMQLFKEHPKVFHTTRWNFTVKEDTPFIRSQIEQEPIEAIQ